VGFVAHPLHRVHYVSLLQEMIGFRLVALLSVDNVSSLIALTRERRVSAGRT
jgi:hypothetical protein